MTSNAYWNLWPIAIGVFGPSLWDDLWYGAPPGPTHHKMLYDFRQIMIEKYITITLCIFLLLFL